jgi:hypothetical protein
MRPLTPDERAEILARHPGVGEEQVDRFEALLAQRFALERQDAGVAAIEAAEEQLRDMQARVFPAWDAAMAAAAARRVAADDREDEAVS